MNSLEQKRGFFELMVRIRRFEEKVDWLFSRNLIAGTSHLCVGQEAVAVGAVDALSPGDYVVSNHRGHGHFIACGADVGRLMAELMGKEPGYCRGRGGSQHVCWIERGFIGTNGITGGGLPIATGAAFSARYRKSGQVVLCFFGEGASNQGTFHESLNMASIWRLPIVYVCENNLYAMSTPVACSMNVEHVAERAKAYGMPGEVVDGMDPFAVRQAVAAAVEGARAGDGPSLIEAKTYRFLGHSKSDRCLYRSREEEAAWRERDPVLRLSAELEEELGADQVAELEAAIEEEIERAVAFGRQSRPASREVALGREER